MAYVRLLAIPLMLQVWMPLACGGEWVVLHNGNAIQGDVQRQSRQTIVRTEDRELRIPSSDVAFVATSLHSAYRTQSARLPGSARGREKLVRWCLQVGLQKEAEAELDRLRRQQPNYSGIDVLARQVRTRRSEQPVLPTPAPQPRDRQFALDRLDMLSSSSVSTYVREIQPLLVNRCATAGCHGKAGTPSFSLSRSKASTNVTHRNLGAVLRQIEGSPPLQSLFWMSASAPHGGLEAEPMKEAELRRLLPWVEQVSGELRPSYGSVQQVSAELPVDSDVDPFDPAEFNALQQAKRETLAE